MSGLFESHTGTAFDYYHARLAFRGWLMGGVPKDPKVIEGWLRTKAGITDQEELRQALLRTLAELDPARDPAELGRLSYAELSEAVDLLAGSKQTNGFKRDDLGLYVEGRQIKSGLKETVNILFAGGKWGSTRKGPRSFAAERIFVQEDRISLGVTEPSGVHLFIGHVTDRQGPRSTLTYVEYVDRAEVAFTVMVTKGSDDLATRWPLIWLQAQELGFGALRSQGYGRFDITEWTPVIPDTRPATPGRERPAPARSMTSRPPATTQALPPLTPADPTNATHLIATNRAKP